MPLIDMSRAEASVIASFFSARMRLNVDGKSEVRGISQTGGRGVRMMTKGLCGTAALAMLAVVAGCEKPTAQLTKEDISRMDSREVCGRYAFSQSINQSVPALDAERRSRGLSCESQVDSVVGICSAMSIVSYGPVDALRGRGNLYTVRNSSPQPRRFRIFHSGISSQEFTIRSNSMEDFGVGTSNLTSMIGESGSGRTTPELFGCQAL